MTRKSLLIAFLLTFAAASSLVGQSADALARRIIVKPGDVLRIGVWPDSTFGGTFMVEETGSVYIPLIGEFKVAGREINDIRADLRTRYKEALRTPIVTVMPEYRISVLGAVERPGLFTVDATMTFIDAVSLAGGFTRDAKPDQISIIRAGRTIKVNAADAQLTGFPQTQSLPLESGDRIIVPAKRGATAQVVLNVVQTVAVITSVILQLR